MLYSSSSLSSVSFLRPDVGEPISLGRIVPGMGRTARYKARQGHFQGQARQLTSPAFGRAILQPRGVHGYLALPNRYYRSFGAQRLDGSFYDCVIVWQILMLAADSKPF
jgi:hypothetical protein